MELFRPRLNESFSAAFESFGKILDEREKALERLVEEARMRADRAWEENARLSMTVRGLMQQLDEQRDMKRELTTALAKNVVLTLENARLGSTVHELRTRLQGEHARLKAEEATK